MLLSRFLSFSFLLSCRQGVLDLDPQAGSQKVAMYFRTTGEAMSVALDRRRAAEDALAYQSVVVTSLVPGTSYEVYCYAEDVAEPEPNSISPLDVRNAMRAVKTLTKVPSVKIVRRQTLQRGFKIFVTADAPGRAWCAAAPTDYGLPDVFEIVDKGAMTEIKEPGRGGWE